MPSVDRRKTLLKGERLLDNHWPCHIVNCCILVSQPVSCVDY